MEEFLPRKLQRSTSLRCRHGSQLFQGKFRIYHQGGLDSYCGFYAIFKLINFLHFKTTRNDDYIGESDFEAFVAIRDLPSFERFFPETPFGGEGVEAPTLIGPLYLALERAGLKGKARIEEEGSIPLDDKRQKDSWFRIGVEKAFTPPLDVLGLAAVREDSKDALEHWVVFVGKNIFVGKNELKNSEIDSWHGVVLDSDRDYLYWRKINDRATPRIEIERSDKTQQKLYWISSFISVSVA